jgi:ketosteroid isomerase-like protein
MSPLERRLLDEIEIQRLAAAYSHAAMRLDGAAAASVYAEDGVLTAFYKPDIIGRAAIAEALTLTFAPLEFLAQTCGAGVIDVDGDTAIATWTVTELLKRREGEGLACCFGSYEDRLVRTADGWRFAHRRFLPFYRGSVAGGGRAYGEPGFERPLPEWPPAIS